MDSIYRHTYEVSKPYIANFRNAIDVGAKKAQYARELIKDFDHVFCFEPRVSRLYKKKPLVKFFNKGLRGHLDKISLYGVALGDEEKDVLMTAHGVLVDGDKAEGSRFMVAQKKLDSFNFTDVDYIKVDVEGHELKVLQGGVETVRRCKPLIVIEQNEELKNLFGKEDTFAATKFLLSLGYKLVAHDGLNDYVFHYG